MTRYLWLSLALSWDLFLAALPWPLGRLFVRSLRIASKRRFAIPLSLLLGAAWLAFLPNSLYLLTVWRHLLLDPFTPLTAHPGLVNPQYLWHTALWIALLSAYTLLGAVFFVLAVRPVEAWLRERGISPVLLAPAFFYLVSLGVYAGFGPRLNSWDLIADPRTVQAVLMRDVLIRPVLLANFLFAAVIWYVYVATGLLMDGARAWWERRQATSARISGPGGH